jgi:hypothetical protein
MVNLKSPHNKKMKTKLLKLTLGIALFGTVTSASAQTSLVAGWNEYNSSSQTFPYAASTIDASASSAAMNYAGLFGFDDIRGRWASTNYNTTLDTATAPYLSWTVNLASGTTVSDATFFIDLAKVDSSTTLSLRSSLDDYGTSLGDLSSVNSSYQNYMFSLGTLSDSATFRLYVYDVSAGKQTTSDDLYSVACFNASTTYGGTYNADMADYTAGLMGNITTVPEPSTLALAGLSGLGMLLFRRLK